MIIISMIAELPRVLPVNVQQDGPDKCYQTRIAKVPLFSCRLADLSGFGNRTGLCFSSTLFLPRPGGLQPPGRDFQHSNPV